MNRSIEMAGALGLLLLTACGGTDADSANAGAAQGNSNAPSGEASAEEVAKEMRGKVKCPARASTVRPAGAPIDDVVGVRPGMSWNEAANFVTCDKPLLVVTETSMRGYDINTYGQHVRQGFDAKFAEPRVVKTSDQVVKDIQNEAMRRGANSYVAPLLPGQVRYFVSFMGLPGQEQVISVSREEYFADGKLPTVDGVKAALIGKYGEPSQDEVVQDGYTRMLWQYDPAGARIAPNSQGRSTCMINVVSPDAATSLSPDCGVTVGAFIKWAKDNAGLAHSLAVTSQNGREGYTALTRTEEELRKADDTRKLNELNKAKKGAAGLKL